MSLHDLDTRKIQKRARQLWVLLGAWIMPVIVALVATVIVDRLAFLAEAEQFVRDLEIAAADTREEPQDKAIIIAAINEDTLFPFPYREPVDRKFLSELLRAVASYRPLAIGLDILFDHGTEKPKDDDLAEALRGLKIPAIVMYSHDPRLVVGAERQTYIDAFVPRKMRALPNFVHDQADTVRWVFPGDEVPGNGFVPGFAPALAAHANVDTAGLRDRDCSPRCLEIVWHRSPGNGQDPFTTFAAQQFLDPKLSALFKRIVPNKFVLIGGELSLEDRHRTPLAAVYGESGMLPGVVIHAHALSQLIHGIRMRVATWWEDFLVALMLSFAGAALGVWNRSLALRLTIGVLAIVLLWVAGFALFRYWLVDTSLITPTLAGIGAFAAMDSITGRRERRLRHFVQNAFSRYVSPAVVERLVRDPERMSLEGERRVMTYLFSDIESFTTMSEKLDSRELAKILNSYLEGVTHCVLRYDGMIDKFIGDSVFAIFNAPADLADHAQCAVRCAMEMDQFARQYSQELEARGITFGMTRTGIHTGPAVIGNFGSSTRFNYTATGDAVNLASRLEGLNKHFHTHISVSESAKELCPDISFRPIAVVAVKGRAEPIEVWQPLDNGTAMSALVQRYNTAYAALKNGQPDAEALFAALAVEAPDDPLVKLHTERIARGERGVTIAMAEK